MVLPEQLPGLSFASFSLTPSLGAPRTLGLGPEWMLAPIGVSRSKLSQQGLLCAPRLGALPRVEAAGCPLQPGDLHAYPVPLQRALLEQKQKKKRQEPLMVQANADGRPRSRRARQSEEQAPLVESYLSSSGSTSYQGTPCPWDSQPGRLRTPQGLLLT